MMEMKEYKVVVKNNEEAEEVRNLFELLGYKKESFHFNCYYPRSVVTQYRYEWLSTGHACDCENGEELTIQQLRDLVAQSKNEQGLISGADALRALADGKEVELQVNGDINWHDSTQWTVGELLTFKGAFRLKPRTITLNIEIPAPFEPKDGDTYWAFHPAFRCGYAESQYLDISKDKHKVRMQFGAWRTEAEIKQVVAALRGVLKNG